MEAKIGVGYWLLLSILTFDAGLQPLPVQGPGHKKRVLKCRFQDFRPDGPNIKCQLEQIQYTTDSNLPSHTDSIYISFSRNSLDDAVKPHLLDAFKSSVYDHCSKPDYEADSDNFLCRKCCDAYAAYDLRTVSLYKLECEGSRFVGLCSKTYVVRAGEGAGEESDKFSCKGVQKVRLQQAGNVYECYKDVLTSGRPYEVTNKGFRHVGHTTYTYTLRKKALSFLYIKRLVGHDNISTSPLPLVLNMEDEN